MNPNIKCTCPFGNPNISIDKHCPVHGLSVTEAIESPSPVPTSLSAEGMKEEYVIGNVVPYINTASKMCWAEITSFKIIERNNKQWFYGIDVKTKAEVFYPSHLSKNYLEAMEQYASSLLTQREDTIREHKEKLKQLLSEVYQLISGFSLDEVWSEWDESVRRRVVEFQELLNK